MHTRPSLAILEWTVLACILQRILQPTSLISLFCSLLPPSKNPLPPVKGGDGLWVTSPPSPRWPASANKPLSFIYISTCLWSIGFCSGRQPDLLSVTGTMSITCRQLTAKLISSIQNPLSNIQFSYFKSYRNFWFLYPKILIDQFCIFRQEDKAVYKMISKERSFKTLILL